MYRPTPNCAPTYSTPLFSGVNTSFWRSGATRPKSEGPSKTPAIISQTTCGCLRYFCPSHPTTRQVARMTAICRKNVIDRLATDMRPLGSTGTLIRAAGSDRPARGPLNLPIDDRPAALLPGVDARAAVLLHEVGVWRQRVDDLRDLRTEFRH